MYSHSVSTQQYYCIIFSAAIFKMIVCVCVFTKQHRLSAPALNYTKRSSIVQQFPSWTAWCFLFGKSPFVAAWNTDPTLFCFVSFFCQQAVKSNTFSQGPALWLTPSRALWVTKLVEIGVYGLDEKTRLRTWYISLGPWLFTENWTTLQQEFTEVSASLNDSHSTRSQVNKIILFLAHTV